MSRSHRNRSPVLAAWIPGLLLLAALAAVACEKASPVVRPDVELSANRAEKAATYLVTVTNTTGAVQPLTPSVVALHNPATGIFEVGTPASSEVERVAESGDLGPLQGTLGATNQVFDFGVAFGPSGPIKPGESGSVELKGPPGLRISLVSMLVCTNDGFTGLNGVRLPEQVGESVTFHTDGYDAGTETNTEAASDLVPVPACGGTNGGDQPGLAEGGVIHHHPGILGVGDLDPATYDWTDPVAMIVIERVG